MGSLSAISPVPPFPLSEVKIAADTEKVKSLGMTLPPVACAKSKLSLPIHFRRRGEQQKMKGNFLVLFPPLDYYPHMLLYNTTRYDEDCGYEHLFNKTWQKYKAHTGAKKMSQSDICRKLGFVRSCISNIEAGKGNPTLAKIENIAQTLNVSIEKLLK